MAQENSISSIVRTIKVVKFIIESDKEYTFNELYDYLHIPKTTLFRILSSLQKENWIEKNGMTYSAGNGIIQIGMYALSRMELRKVAIPWLDKLSKLTGETANLAVLSGKKALIVEVCDGPKHIKISSRPGTLIDLYYGAGGKVLMAFAVKEKVSQFYQDLVFEKRTRNTITNVQELEKEIEKVRKQGYAVDDMEYYDDVRCVAAPVRNVNGQTIAALGITAPTSSLRKQDIEPMARIVVEIADSISRSMGEIKD